MIVAYNLNMTFDIFQQFCHFLDLEKNIGDQRGQFYPRRKNISLKVQDISYMILCTKNQHFIINNTLTLEVWKNRGFQLFFV